MSKDRDKDLQGEVAQDIRYTLVTPEDKENWESIVVGVWHDPTIQGLVKVYEQQTNDPAEESLQDIAKAVYKMGLYAAWSRSLSVGVGEIGSDQEKQQHYAERRTPEQSNDKPVNYKISETPAELECRLAANEYMKMILSARRDVMHFRSQLPEGKCMDIDQAIDFLALPLCRYFEFKQLEEWNVCPSAETRLVSIQALTGATGAYFPIHQWLDRMTIDQFLRPTVAITVSMTTRDGKTIEKWADHNTSDYLVLAQGNSHKSYISDSQYTHPVRMNNATNAQFGMPIRTAEGFRRSIVGEALGTSERISRACGWDPTGALFFLLTGEIVHDQGCLSASTHQMHLPQKYAKSTQDEEVWGTTSYTLHPWVSVASMKKLYDVVKRRHGNKSMPTERNVKIFRFVNQQRSEKPGMTWEALNAVWCLWTGESGTQPSNLSRDYWAAKRSIFPRRNNYYDHL